MNSKQDDTLSGLVERITFHNSDTGFCVFKVKVQGKIELISVIGSSLHLHVGEQVDCRGEWANDRQYGLQFRAQQIKTIPPSTLEGIERYLGSGLLKGVGPHFAKLMVNAFGKEVFEVLDNTPERLGALAGFGQKRASRVLVSWALQKEIHDIMVFLQSHGMGSLRAARIYKTYGKEAISLVQANPYRLALDIPGIGFKTADMLAVNLGIPPQSVIRAEAGVRHVLQESAQQGHCAKALSEVLSETALLLDIPATIIHQAIEHETTAHNIVAEGVYGGPYLFLKRYYWAEQGIVKHLKRLQASPHPCKLTNSPEHYVDHAQTALNMTLSPTQYQAVLSALKHKVLIITGGPGVGKTTILKVILTIFEEFNTQLLLCAPTGRAAKRLSDSTQMEAKTLHRLLEYDPATHFFRRGADLPLLANWFIMDECSMVDVSLFNAFLSSIPDAAGVILVGDVDQLPSVGPGAVLSNLIQSQSIATIALTEIHRQAKTSQIILNAHRINQGLMPIKSVQQVLSDFYFIEATSPDDIRDKLLQVVTQRIPARFNLDPIRQVQVLSPMNRGALGVRSLNIDLKQALNRAEGPYVERFGTRFSQNDKVIQIINNYDKEIFNGDIGFIKEIDNEDESLTIEFEGKQIIYDFEDLDELSLAYATTIHKSQGSEYPAVVIPLAMQHYNLLERNLIYTAVTRGRQLVVIVGQKSALGRAVQTVKAGKRLAFLGERLRDSVALAPPVHD